MDSQRAGPSNGEGDVVDLLRSIDQHSRETVEVLRQIQEATLPRINGNNLRATVDQGTMYEQQPNPDIEHPTEERLPVAVREPVHEQRHRYEEPIDPTTCGVCSDLCGEDIYAIDECGHYPYCLNCISQMSTGSAGEGKGLKLRCPHCNQVNVGTYKVLLV